MKAKPIHYIVGLPLACDYIPKDPRHQPHSPTVKRIRACVTMMEKLKPGLGHSFIVCTAGYTKASPLKKPADNIPELPLCEQMEFCILTNYVQYIPVVSIVKGWGTESEIRNGIAQAKLHITPSGKVTLVVSTNLVHMLRVIIYVWKYLPKGWKVKFVCAKHDFSLKSHLREIPGVFHALFFALTYKILGK
ncbi:MAG: hypothetical protein V4686_01270 [Patescibacteria group bacterium]